MMSFEVPEASRAEIERLITSSDSPVGIDAKETHVMILHKLNEIERRLATMEAALRDAGGRG